MLLEQFNALLQWLTAGTKPLIPFNADIEVVVAVLVLNTAGALLFIKLGLDSIEWEKHSHSVKGAKAIRSLRHCFLGAAVAAFIFPCVRLWWPAYRLWYVVAFAMICSGTQFLRHRGGIVIAYEDAEMSRLPRRDAEMLVTELEYLKTTVVELADKQLPAEEGSEHGSN